MQMPIRTEMGDFCACLRNLARDDRRAVPEQGLVGGRRRTLASATCRPVVNPRSCQVGCRPA